jgi:parvulin-like peptidyl-prolyl isomerase
VVASFPESFRDELIEGAARGFAVLDSYMEDPTEAEIRAFYEENRDQFECATGKEVAHILVEDEARANELMGQLAAGASFASLASQFSTDTGSASQGGSLGCLTRGTFVPEFEQAALAAAPGTPVGPVQTQFGYHIILTSAVDNSLDNARPQVVAALQQQSQQEAQAALLERLDRANVKIDPRFGTWGEVDDGQGGTRRQVIPPERVDVRDRRETTTTTVPAAAGQGVP